MAITDKVIEGPIADGPTTETIRFNTTARSTFIEELDESDPLWHKIYSSDPVAEIEFTADEIERLHEIAAEVGTDALTNAHWSNMRVRIRTAVRRVGRL